MRSPSSGPRSPYRVGDRPDLFGGRSIFLSASIPHRRRDKEPATETERQELNHYLATRQPDRIREAVGHLCRAAFSRGIQLIFGGHPQISPMVLEAATRFRSEESPENLVVVFQSLWYNERIPQKTLDLANWRYGTALWTEAGQDRDQSLTIMRQAMVASPGLIGAIFIGGMDGIREEAVLAHQAAIPRLFAIGSTGSAAADLLGQGARWGDAVVPPEKFVGQAADEQTLQELLAYPVVIARVFRDLLGTV